MSIEAKHIIRAADSRQVMVEALREALKALHRSTPPKDVFDRAMHFRTRQQIIDAVALAGEEI